MGFHAQPTCRRMFNIILVYIFRVFANQKKEYSYKIGGHDDDDDDTDDDDDDNDDVSL